MSNLHVTYIYLKRLDISVLTYINFVFGIEKPGDVELERLADLFSLGFLVDLDDLHIHEGFLELGGYVLCDFKGPA